MAQISDSNARSEKRGTSKERESRRQSASHASHSSHSSHSSSHGVKWQVFSNSKRQWLTYARAATKAIEFAYQSGQQSVGIKEDAYIDFTSKPRFCQRIAGNEAFTRAVRRITSGARGDPFADAAGTGVDTSKRRLKQRDADSKRGSVGQQKPVRSDPDSDELEESGMARYPAEFSLHAKGAKESKPQTDTAEGVKQKRETGTEGKIEAKAKTTQGEGEVQVMEKNTVGKSKSGDEKTSKTAKAKTGEGNQMARAKPKEKKEEKEQKDDKERESEEEMRRRQDRERYEDAEYRLYFDEFVKSMCKENPYLHWAKTEPIRLLSLVDADLCRNESRKEEKRSRSKHKTVPKQQRRSVSHNTAMNGATPSGSGGVPGTSKEQSAGKQLHPQANGSYAAAAARASGGVAMFPMVGYDMMPWMGPEQPWGGVLADGQTPFVDNTILCPLPLINTPGESSYLCFCTKAQECDLRLVRARDGRPVRQKPFFAGHVQNYNLFALKYRHGLTQSCASFEFLQRPGDATSKRRVEIITLPSVENGLLLLNAVTSGGTVPTEMDNVVLMFEGLRVLWETVGWDRGPDVMGNPKPGIVVPRRCTAGDHYPTSKDGTHIVSDAFMPMQARILHTYLHYAFPDAFWW